MKRWQQKPQHRRAFRAVETRREYMWEVAAQRASLFSYTAMRTRTMSELRWLCERVIDWECPKRVFHPELLLERGGPTACYGRSHIFIRARHQCYAIALHELVHAMGYDWHTRGFVLRYIELLSEYAACDEALLLISAGLYGVI